MSLAPGTRVGKFEVLSLLGTGGMGEVYRARDSQLKREVALKVLPDGWAAHTDRVARFQREAELLATLNHPNIAAIYGVEESAGVPAIVLELVEGPTLADRLRQGPIPLTEVLAIAIQIAEALDAAHERGIVHRDLKPGNVKMRDDGMVKVLDFGLAKAVEGAARAEPDSSTMTGITRHGVILGTPSYMSPEQARGLAVDKRTDIWAFGCVLFEMIAGRAAFDGPTASDTIAAILERTPEWSALPATTPPGVRHLLQRCLEKDRKLRLRDIGDARSDLDRTEVRAGPAPAIQQPRPIVWPLVGGVLLGGAAIAGLFWMLGDARSGSASFGPQFTRLTSDASFSTEPALSRDGTLVVYASDREADGQMDLWLQRTTGGEPLRLTVDPADDREPDVSPDGSLIAFRSDREPAGVYVMPVLKGDARLVGPKGRSPRFSPDGSRIAYGVPDNWLAGASGTPWSLFIVAASGGPATRIAEGLAIATVPQWSPDGRSLLFFGRAARSPNAAMDWWWMPVGGATPVATGAYQVFDRAGLSGIHGNEIEILPTAWTNDGVLFSARLGDSVNVWRLQISERTGEAIEASLERLTRGAGSDVLPSAGDKGRIAFVVARDVGESLTLPLDPNTGKVKGPATVRSVEAGDAAGRSSLDDSGRWLAYPRSRGTQLWVKDLTSGRERHVVTASVSDPLISHDGTKVAYGDGDGIRSAGYVVPMAGGTARKICDGCVIHGWFADNRRILTFEWNERTSRGHVRALDTDTLTATELLETSRHAGRLDLSPTEQWLVFGQAGRSWIARVRPGSPPPEHEWVSVFERAPGSAERPCGWSPDGRLLYLLLERDGFRDLYAQRIDVATGARVGEPFLVQHFHDPRRRWGSTTYGSAIVNNAFVFTQVETSGGIWLLHAK